MINSLNYTDYEKLSLLILYLEIWISSRQEDSNDLFWNFIHIILGQVYTSTGCVASKSYKWVRGCLLKVMVMNIIQLWWLLRIMLNLFECTWSAIISHYKQRTALDWLRNFIWIFHHAALAPLKLLSTAMEARAGIFVVIAGLCDIVLAFGLTYLRINSIRTLSY